MATLFLTRAIDQLADLATPGADDAELLRRYLDTGDPKAFEHIVRRHARTVLGLCRRILIDPDPLPPGTPVEPARYEESRHV